MMDDRRDVHRLREWIARAMGRARYAVEEGSARDRERVLRAIIEEGERVLAGEEP